MRGVARKRRVIATLSSQLQQEFSLSRRWLAEKALRTFSLPWHRARSHPQP
jgi:hypothetical protein